MSLITISVELPDDDDHIVEWGTEDQASSFLEYASGWYFPGHFRLVSWQGPNKPTHCGCCGEAWHPRPE